MLFNNYYCWFSTFLRLFGYCRRKWSFNSYLYRSQIQVYIDLRLLSQFSAWLLLYWSIQPNFIDLLKYIDGHDKTRGKKSRKMTNSFKISQVRLNILPYWGQMLTSQRNIIPSIDFFFSFTHEVLETHCLDGSLILFYLSLEKNDIQLSV